MSDCLKKSFISLLNLLVIGLGFAVSGQLKKALFLLLGICFLKFSSLILYQSFEGFIAISLCLFSLQAYAAVNPFFIAQPRFVSYWKNGLAFILLAEISLSAIGTYIITHGYETFKINQILSPRYTIQSGDYIMVSKAKTKPDTPFIIAADTSDNQDYLLDTTLLPSQISGSGIAGTPLYIIFSRNFSRIGQPIKKQPENKS